MIGSNARRSLAIAAAVFFLAARPGHTQAVDPAEEPYAVEYYYRVRWGFQDEFWGLFKKNHLPILEEERKLGVLRDIIIERPREHQPEEARWDYRVRLVYRSVVAYARPGLDDAARRRLYPDQATFQREEQRRFELLLAHWDLPVVPGPRD